MHFVADFGHFKIGKLFLEKRTNIKATNEIGLTLLNMAANCGHIKVLRLLLEKVANIEAINKSE